MNSSDSVSFLLYCRAGFERDCASELSSSLKELGFPSTCRYEPQSSYVLCDVRAGELLKIKDKVKLQNLVFARQLIYVAKEAQALPEADRLSPLIASLEEADAFNPEKLYSQLLVESPDTNEGKKLQKFCRKIAQPVANKLKRAGYKKVYSRKDCPQIHIFFKDYQHAFLGFSYPPDASCHEMGIIRLKFPKEAPSRSTLKLEEAFFQFLEEDERKSLLASSRVAVDLGASPGGWTYQFVRRGMKVIAIDNGKIAPALMASGLISHLQQDAFKYAPAKPVDWLVCDMVEKPLKVAHLLATWLRQGWCRYAIVNLKLPMKKRCDELKRCLQVIEDKGALGASSQLAAKQLYHDREEVTLFVRKST